MSRRHIPALLLLALAFALGPPLRPAAGQEEVDRSREISVYTSEAQQAVEGALRWLASTQNPDGSWNALVGFKINDGYRAQPVSQPNEGLPHLGVTALAGMAFLSGGHLPGEGPYGDVVDRALDFVLDKVTDYGFITHNQTRMYSHAFSLLFLAEVYGMTGRADLRDKLDRAAEFTYKSQNEQGGWRYAPAAQDSDMSITVCQVVALRAARNIGIRVPKATIDKALRYVMESADTKSHHRGAFLYQRQEALYNRNSFALTAAGLTTIYQAGLYDDAQVRAFCAAEGINLDSAPRISDCLRFLWREYDAVWREYYDHYFYFYGNYYAAQAMYTRGGREWIEWYSRVRDDLLESATRRRADEGTRVYWESRWVGNAFSTSIAAIILQIPNHYLPIFQR